MTEITVIHDDCKVALRRLIREGVRVHSIMTDPPYGLVSIQKRFGGDNAPARTENNDGSFARLSGGFMGQRWDASGIELDVELWKLCHEILLPGGYLLAFSSPRTGHRMACAIEDAGFVVHPFIGWAYGSGFPKAHAADKAIDKTLGKKGLKTADGTYIPGSQEAQEWQGWAYGGQARKPALEPVYVFQKPFSEKNGALNILKHGVGAVNIDGVRTTEGRYPANLIHDGSPEVVSQFPDALEQQGASSTNPDSAMTRNVYGDYDRVETPMQPRGDSGSAARFFECRPFDQQQIFYSAKAGREDRAGSSHPTVKPIGLLQALVRHVTPPGGLVLDPFAGTGTTAEAARREGFDVILIEREDQYVADIERRFQIDSPQLEYLRLLGW